MSIPNPPPPRRIIALYPHYNTGTANAYTALSICGRLGGDGWESTLMVPASDPHARRGYVRDALPGPVRRLAYRFGSPAAAAAFAECRLMAAVRPGDVVYVWPGVRSATIRRLKARGLTVVAERINCHTGPSKRILDAEYARLGLPPGHDITEAAVRAERAELALCDFVFSPSPLVERSLEAEGVPAGKILPCSYGWDPQRFATGPGRALPSADGPTVLFVGRACVRKGAHLLLDAWTRAGIRGRLVFAGTIDADVAARCAPAFDRPDVVRLGHVRDLGPVYRSADVFAFPSLEEGGPLATYEAMGCGLPVLVSPMGAGRAVRDGLDGVVIDPHDAEAWAAALRRLAGDAELRRHLSAAAARAAEFVWPRVGAVRREALSAALAARSRAAG